MTEDYFYMVFVEGQYTPTYKHTTQQSAETEAKRLAKELGLKAYVLTTIKSFEINEFTVKDCRPSDELPF